MRRPSSCRREICPWCTSWIGSDVERRNKCPIYGQPLQVHDHMIYGAEPGWSSANYDFDSDYKRLAAWLRSSPIPTLIFAVSRPPEADCSFTKVKMT
jgi:hypothetical protein